MPSIVCDCLMSIYSSLLLRVELTLGTTKFYSNIYSVQLFHRSLNFTGRSKTLDIIP